MVKAIVGANWGDEGKGKMTDMLAQEADTLVAATVYSVQAFPVVRAAEEVGAQQG